MLGSVMAHEIGHLLLGSHAHAISGIMRGHWESGELHQIAMGTLRFLPWRGPSRFWGSPTTVGSATATEPSSSGGLRRRSEWRLSSKPSRLSCYVVSIIARSRLVHGFARLCWATTSTMLFRATRHSCAPLVVASAGCGARCSYAAVNVRR